MNHTITVEVELFGRAATQSGERTVILELPGCATMRDAASALAARYPVLAWVPLICRPARNLEYGSWEERLSDGDQLCFIPPVSGG